MERLKKLIALAYLIGWMGLGSGVAQGAEFTLRYAGNLPLSHHVSKGQELLAKLIDQQTGGRVKVLVYPSGQLFSDKDMVKAVPTGAVDMAVAHLHMWAGAAPILGLGELPLFFNDRRHVWRVVDGEAGEMLKREFEKGGVKFLCWIDYGAIDFASKEPIRTLEDFKGKRIRAHAELAAEALKAYGAAPTFLGGGEVYMALQRGTIDGAISGTTSFWDRKYFEITKYITLANYGFTIYAVVMNSKKWNELPPDNQKTILDCSREVQEWTRKEAEKADMECLELLKKKGMEVYVVPNLERERWRKASKPAIDSFLKSTGEKGKVILELAEKAR